MDGVTSAAPARAPANWRLGLRFARRELRAGPRGLWLVLACLALGVAAIAAVGTLRAATEAGLATDGARLLGGDLEIQVSYRPIPDVARDWLGAHGARVSEVVQMRAMAVAPSGQRSLVELKAVDGAYPLYGTLRLDPAGPLGDGIALDPLVAERLGLHVGDVVRLGEAHPTLRALIAEEPDRVATVAALGPRALIALGTLPATQLIQPGSQVQYRYRLALPPNTEIAGFTAALRAAFPDGGWRIRNATEAAPGVARFVDDAAAFLTLAGLSALLVGGIGVATGVRSWLDARSRSIATLRCLGAPAGAIFWTYLIQLGVLAALGTAAGLLAGFAATAAAVHLLAGVLPVPARLGFFPAPLGLAALYGLLTALCFALWPLGRAREIPGAALFRDTVQLDAARPRRGLIVANAAAALLLVGLVVGTARDPRFALWFCLAAAAALLLFRLGAAALMRFARWVSGAVAGLRRKPWLRLGLGNLHRPGAPTPLVLVSLGIGLTTLSAVALIQGNIQRDLTAQLPQHAPSFYVVDLQSDQVPRFDALAKAAPGVTEVRRVPSLRARIVAIKGVPVEQVRASEDSQWALRGDRGLTYAAALPEGTHLLAGEWWPADYNGPPLVSLDAGLARGWNVGVGDAVTLNVLGRDVTFRVASLRDIAWRNLGLNFALIASPGLLEAAPHTFIGTLRNPPGDDAAVLRVLTDAFPNISMIGVRDAIEAVAGLLGRLGLALSAVGGVTLLAGGLVLAGAVAAGQRRRVRDAVVLKTLGATRGQLRAAYLVEFGLLGLTAGVLAALAGTLASWGVVRFAMRMDWVFLPGTLLLTVLLCTGLTLAFGFVGTAFALRAKPAPLLRNE